MMDEGTASDSIPDLKDIEMKIGRKTPEGLLRWMREEASCVRGDAKLSAAGGGGGAHDAVKETGRKSLDDKIRKLKMEMAHLRSVDVKILQQLLTVHEGIEAVKWLLEERSTLTSRCSSLTSSQYSLGEGPDTSWRGSWSSLQDPNDKLDNISIGSYLDTLADDMDEYCPSSSESVICSTTPLVSEATVGSRTTGGPGAAVATSAGVKSGPAAGAENGNQAGINENSTRLANGTDARGGSGKSVCSVVCGPWASGTGKPAAPYGSPKAKSEAPKQEIPIWTKAPETAKGSPVFKDNILADTIKSNGVREKATSQTGSPVHSKSSQSPKHQAYKNGKIDLETCKMNGKMHLEYDAHWRWVQSQEDVTFL
ncbi:unnamed protein product [Ophioblennius macclurei]